VTKADIVFARLAGAVPGFRRFTVTMEEGAHLPAVDPSSPR
jgi:hypothetical protein